MGWGEFTWEDLIPPQAPSGGSYDFAFPEMPQYGGYDPGAGENLGQYDFGRIEVPPWAGFDPWETPDTRRGPDFAGEMGYTFDPTTGQVTGPAGVPVGAEGGFGDPEAAARAARGEAPFGSPWGPGGPGGPPASPNIPLGQAGAAGAAEARRLLDAAGRDRYGGGGGPGAPGGIEGFLGTNLGRILAATGVGAVGLGAQQLLAGGTPTYRPPTYTPTPVTQAGQAAVLRALEGPAGPALTEAMEAGVTGQRDIARQVAERVGRETLAEQEMAPGERGIRMASLADIQALMQRGAEAPIADPIEQAIRQELLGVLGGGGTGVSPATGRRQALEEQEVRARLFRQLGEQYELTTPGIQTLREMKERHNSEQYTERQATIARLSPLEESRMRFSTVTPTDLLGRREGLRRANLGDVERLSQFGIRGTPQNLTALGGIAPVQTYLGGDPERANLVNTQLQAGAAQAAFGGETARRANLSRGIGDIAGLVAGTVAARPSSAEDYYARLIRRDFPGAY